MTDQPVRPAMTMREIRDALGHTAPSTMTDRIPLDDLTSDALDQLYADRERYRLAAQALGKRAEQAEAAIERAQKLATQWAVLRAYGSAATELRQALEEPQQSTTMGASCPGCGCKAHAGFCDSCGCLDSRERGACTCAAAGACFAPAGHYADCPAAEQQP